jgi:hypothetical protein
MNAYVLMAFNAAGRSSKIVMAWPESENLTSADLSRATAAEMVANMRAERRCVLDNRDEIMVLYLILELMAYLAFQMAARHSGSSKSVEWQGPASHALKQRAVEDTGVTPYMELEFSVIIPV